MTEAIEATDDRMGSATFGYQVNDFDSEKAASWLKFYPSVLGNDFNRLSIQVNKADVYTVFMNRLSANGYKLKKSSIVNGGIIKIYRNSSLTCIVQTGTSEGMYTKSTSYSFFFIDNQSYDLNYEKEE